jgi:hypothetical protein
MTHNQFVSFWAAILWHQARLLWNRHRAARRLRRAYLGRHDLDQAAYYGHSAYSVIIRLRAERRATV